MKARFDVFVVVYLLGNVLLTDNALLPALAHHAPSGWQYPEECCRDSGDCQMVHEKNISTDEEGYVVTLEAGEHRHAPNGGTFYFLEKQVRISGDSDYHVCIHRYANGPGALCLYVPPRDMTSLGAGYATSPGK